MQLRINKLQNPELPSSKNSINSASGNTALMRAAATHHGHQPAYQSSSHEQEGSVADSETQETKKQQVVMADIPLVTCHSRNHLQKHPQINRQSDVLQRLTSAPWHLAQNYVGHGLAAIAGADPTTVDEARNSPNSQQWEQAMVEEMESQQLMGTWYLTELPPGRQPIKCKWIFRKKVLADGSLERYKARLVAKGCSQQEGIDYEETFAPVMKFTTFRMLLAKAAVEDLELHQVDVVTAFLHGDLEEEIYMLQPDGFQEKGSEHLVCRLKKALYGLKQAPRSWYHKLEEFHAQHWLSHVRVRTLPVHTRQWRSTGAAGSVCRRPGAHWQGPQTD